MLDKRILALGIAMIFLACPFMGITASGDAQAESTCTTGAYVVLDGLNQEQTSKTRINDILYTIDADTTLTQSTGFGRATDIEGTITASHYTYSQYYGYENGVVTLIVHYKYVLSYDLTVTFTEQLVKEKDDFSVGEGAEAIQKITVKTYNQGDSYNLKGTAQLEAYAYDCTSVTHTPNGWLATSTNIYELAHFVIDSQYSDGNDNEFTVAGDT